MSHRSTQPRTPASGSRDIVCVEWSGPADALALIDRCRAPRLFDRGPSCAYVVECDGAPLYVGGTRYGLGYRLHMHEVTRSSPVRPYILAARAGGSPVTVRWIEAPEADAIRLEGQLHRAIQAPLNSIDRFWRNVPALPDRMVA